MQDLSHLSDEQIDAVIDAVTHWCRSQGVALESERGRRAVIVAANLISSSKAIDFQSELYAHLEQRSSSQAEGR